MARRDWLGLKEELPERLRLVLTIFSFVLPLAPLVRSQLPAFLLASSDADYGSGSVEYFVEGMEVPNAEFARQAGESDRGGRRSPDRDIG